MVLLLLELLLLLLGLYSCLTVPGIVCHCGSLDHRRICNWVRLLCGIWPRNGRIDWRWRAFRVCIRIGLMLRRCHRIDWAIVHGKVWTRHSTRRWLRTDLLWARMPRYHNIRTVGRIILYHFRALRIVRRTREGTFTSIIMD